MTAADARYNLFRAQELLEDLGTPLRVEGHVGMEAAALAAEAKDLAQRLRALRMEAAARGVGCASC
jgi:hypothetical protein